MKKIFKSQKIKYLLFFILGGIIIGGIGITATTYVLKSNEIQYTNDKSVQQAIDELFVKAENCGKGSSETLPIGDVSVKSLTVKVPYTGTYKDIKCLYGTTEAYGNRGTIDNNICTFMGTSGSQTLYYKIIASNDDGKIYENSGSATTGIETNVILTDIPKGTKAIIYLDPTNLNATCNESNSTSTTGTKSGCMKWYAFKEDGTSYTMILDHNTTGNVEWNSDGNNTSMKEVQIELDNLVSSSIWKVVPRLITYDEVINITGSSIWNATDSISEYYWLFDYTYGCTSYGCKVADGSYGYWTSTPTYGHSGNSAWTVRYDGSLYSYHAYVTSNVYGVRPVITISKSNL